MKMFKKTILFEQGDFSDSNKVKSVKVMGSNPDSLLLLPESEKIYSVVSDLSKDCENDTETLTRVRIAYNIEFPFPTSVCELGNTGGKFKDLQSMLEALSYNDNGSFDKPYRVIINDSAVSDNEKSKELNAFVANLFQQMIFLNLSIDVVKESEIHKNNIKNRFRSKYGEFKKLISELENNVKDIEISEFSQEYVDKISSAIAEIKEQTAKAEKRPIKIAAMGTKKAGKSVIINSILHHEYAPTSLTLPTPNCIVYKPVSSDSDLELEYKGKRLAFASDKELKKYIEREFEEAQKQIGEGAAIPDMTIYYPSGELTGYEIYDTPGPNFAGAGDSHRKRARECIEIADICIFVMNYSNHLTDDEVEFLNEIREAFEKNGKFYSLFIAINKIDDRYGAEENKSINSLVDYIRNKLHDLGYKNVMTFGTSARQYFYLETIKKLFENSNSSFGTELNYDAIKKMKKAQDYKEQKTELVFLQNMFGNLEDFHAIENPIEDDLRRFSGIPQLLDHCRYIGEQKADLEIVDFCVRKIDESMALINNILKLTGLRATLENDDIRIKELAAIIERMQTTVAAILKNVEKVVDEDQRYRAIGELDCKSKSTKKEASKSLVDSLNTFSTDDHLVLEDMKSLTGTSRHLTNNLKRWQDDIVKFQKESLKESYKKIRALAKDSYDKRIKEIQRVMDDSQKSIIEAVNDIKKSVQDDKLSPVINEFSIPEFDPVLSSSHEMFDDIKSLSISEMQVLVRNYIGQKRVERDPDGFWESIQSFFGGKFYKNVPDYKFTEWRKAIYDKSKKDGEEVLNKFLDDEIERLKTDMEKEFDKVEGQCKTYQKVFEENFNMSEKAVKGPLTETKDHKKTIEDDTRKLGELCKSTEPLYTCWQDIIRG